VLTVVAALVLRLLAQVTVAVSAPAEVAPRDPVLVRVEVTAPAGRSVRIVPPDFAPLRVLSSMRVPSLDSTPPGGGYILRPPWQIQEWRYVLGVPDGVRGRLAFEPFVAEVSGRGLRPGGARSRAWGLSVRAPIVPASVPAIVDRVPKPSRQGIAFHAQIGPDTVYVGQQATYQIAVFLDDEARTRLRRNPEFVPPELRGLLAYDLPAGRASLRGRVIDGRRYDVHVFQRALFPVAAGRVAIPPAQLTYALPLTSGFFSREESFSTRSEAVAVVAIDPPAVGRPADWTGAVGDLRASARLDSSAARVGDPVILTLRVEGRGNVKLLPRPTLDIPWATAVEGAERVELDSTALAVRGAKEFDWILTARAAGDRTVPAIRYSYFDPVARRYDAAASAPMPLQVLPGTLASGGGADGRPARGAPLPIRLSFGGEVGVPLPTRPTFWLLVALVPLPAVLVGLASRVPRRRTTRMAPARALRVLADARASTPPAEVRRAFVGAVRERLALGREAFAAPDALARRLRRSGVTAEGARAAADMLRTLDGAAFGATHADDAQAGAPDGGLARGAWIVYARLDAEGCGPRTARRGAPAGAPRAGLVLLLTGAIALAAATAGDATQAAPQPAASPAGAGNVTVLQRQRAEAGDSTAAAAVTGAGGVVAAREFGRGVRAYERGRWAEARDAFASAAAAAPRAPDSWANVGTVAWALGDTVTAAVGWQRALRLAPLASDMRDRLALLPASQDGWTAGVPPVPADVAAAVGLLAWAVASALVLRRVRRRAGPRVAPLAWASAAAAVLLLAGSVRLGDVADATELAIVRGDGAARVEPVLSADQSAPVQVSDVARIVGRQNAWSRVRLDGDREGWIESDRLVPLALP
jgi:hypothetical protein